jgi:hypothetical protein
MNSVAQSFLLTGRAFLENMLGFGEPIEDASLSSLFKTDNDVFHYGRGPNAKASINAVTQANWLAGRAASSGTVLHDLYSSVEERAHSFIIKQLAREGYHAMEPINPTYGKAVKELGNTVKFFFDNYRLLYPDARLHSTMILQKRDEKLQWDMVIEVYIEREGERIYLKYLFPKIIYNVSFLVKDPQVQAVTAAMQQYYRTFGRHGSLLTEFINAAFSNHLVHVLIHNNAITPEEAFNDFMKVLTVNPQMTANMPHSSRQFWMRGLQWEAVSPTIKVMVTCALDMARLQISSYYTVNIREATEA